MALPCMPRPHFVRYCRLILKKLHALSLSDLSSALQIMAKTKQTIRHDSKSARHVVSTSQVFKKAKKPASPKPQHLKGKTVSRKAPEEGDGSTKRKRQPASQDSDLIEFNGHISCG